ncbi:hypothetical protein K9K85_03090 [Patescibacteria group bacterium]|nr:hypothetical protein [Patescibacteria group bacterium]
MSNELNHRQGISLIITILIISSILVSTITVGDVLIRHSQTVKSVEDSEMAYFATESVLEKAKYEIFKNYENASSYSLSGSLDNGATYEILSADIEYDSYFSIDLDPGESFEIALDLNGTDLYPSTLSITQSGSVSTDLIVYQCLTGGTPRICTTGYTQTLYSSLPLNLSISEEDRYYRIRINNLSASSSETYNLSPSGGDLPIGIDLTAKGVYGDYERRSRSNYPKWQIFGS